MATHRTASGPFHQGTDAAFYAFLWLYISAAGPGPWSLPILSNILLDIDERRRRVDPAGPRSTHG
jgi:hypothetical protein